MKHRNPVGILLLVLAAALLLLAACNKSSESDQAEEQLKAMEEQIASLQQEMEAAKNELEESQQQEIEDKITAMKSDLANTRKELAEARKKEEAADPPAETATALTPDPPTPPEPEPEPEPRVVTLPAGSPIVIRTTTAMSTKTVETGQPFEASLEEPLTDGQWIVAAKGARVRGVVAESSKGGRGKNNARLVLRVDTIQTDDGQELAVRTTTVQQNAVAPKKKKQALKVGIGAGVGAAIGGLAGGGKGAGIGAGAGAGAGAGSILLTYGPPAELAAESVLNLKLADPITITEQK
jgi:hypothetical protein